MSAREWWLHTCGLFDEVIVCLPRRKCAHHDCYPRRVAVLDPGSAADVDALADAMDNLVGTGPGVARAVIHRLTRPPHIPEPGRYGVVQAAVSATSERAEWVRLGVVFCPWVSRTGEQAEWDELLDPVLVREGVDDA